MTNGENSGPKKRLWNMNFTLLWVGQFISALGDATYSIALGFWILAVTGSTALMGTLMAASSLPRVLVSAFAGVIVDRSERKWLLILMDVVRGAVVILVGIAAYMGFAKVWMVFVAGVIIGLGGAFFNPAVSSSIPDLVDRSRLVQANSVFNMIYTGSGLVGNSAGGFLYKVLGAPFMFLFNGVSYIASAVSILFVRIPKIAQRVQRPHFFADLKGGFTFAWGLRGLRATLISAGILNFFAVMGIMLILPLFERFKHLGPGLYGLLMAIFAGGLLLGFLFTSMRKFKAEERFGVFSVCFVLMSISMIMLPVSLYFPLMAFFGILTGFVNAISNALLGGVLQMTVPQDMRGKVFGLLNSIVGGLNPVAFALGGVLAEFIPVRLLISGSFVVTLFLYIPLFLSKSFRTYINFNPETQKIEDLMR